VENRRGPSAHGHDFDRALRARCATRCGLLSRTGGKLGGVRRATTRAHRFSGPAPCLDLRLIDPTTSPPPGRWNARWTGRGYPGSRLGRADARLPLAVKRTSNLSLRTCRMSVGRRWLRLLPEDFLRHRYGRPVPGHGPTRFKGGPDPTFFFFWIRPPAFRCGAQMGDAWGSWPAGRRPEALGRQTASPSWSTCSGGIRAAGRHTLGPAPAHSSCSGYLLDRLMIGSDRLDRPAGVGWTTPGRPERSSNRSASPRRG